ASPDSEHRPTLVWASPSGPPKPPSANFKAKRMQHYNEFKVLQAMRETGSPAASDSSGDECDRSKGK
ncbi:unnamed protein product, partial [Polarella glacialis]